MKEVQGLDHVNCICGVWCRYELGHNQIEQAELASCKVCSDVQSVVMDNHHIIVVLDQVFK